MSGEAAGPPASGPRDQRDQLGALSRDTASDLKLGPRYQLVATLASGGMGTVYLGRVTEDDGTVTPVAIKVLHPHLAQDPDVVAMFVDEARVATRLHHPNAIHVRDVDLLGDELVIVMNYVEGLPLSQILRRMRQGGQDLPIGVAVRIVVDALRGLHAAHELTTDDGRSPLELVHRDVSPHNVLVGTDGAARVSDFGVATSAGRVASTRADGTVKGKLQYLAPEQAQRKSLDRRVDVFAGGIVLWECLVGRRLFAGGTEAETLAMVLREPIAPPSTHRRDVAPLLDEICLKALERDPSRRYQTAEAFADALEQASTSVLGVPLAPRAQVAELVETLGGDRFERYRKTLLEAPAPGRNASLRARLADSLEPPAGEHPSGPPPAPPLNGPNRVTAAAAAVAIAAATILLIAVTRNGPAGPAGPAPEGQATAAVGGGDPATAGGAVPAAASGAAIALDTGAVGSGAPDEVAAGREIELDPNAGGGANGGASGGTGAGAAARGHAVRRAKDGGSTAAPGHARHGASGKPARPFMPSDL